MEKYHERKTARDDEYIVAYLETGSQTKAAKICGVSRETVARAVRRAGLKLTGRNTCGGSKKKITDEQILYDIACGLTRQEIADKHGVHIENLARRMRNLGVHARHKPRCKKIRISRSWEEYKKDLQVKTEEKRKIKELEKAKYIDDHTVERKCEYCGRSFYCLDTENKKTCSHECRKKLSNIRRDRRIPRNQRIDTITIQRLFDRDGGKCYICGGLCDFDDWATSNNGNKYPGDTYPTIDHVIPISKGGLDAWNNVGLAHWKCNIAKSDSLIMIKPLSDKIAYSQRSRQAKKRTGQYTLDWELIKIWDSTAQIKRELGFCDKHIQNVCRENRETLSAYGFRWKYLDDSAEVVKCRIS